MSNAVTSVTKPVFDQGLQSIKFFNGRLLSGEDLTAEQAANRYLHARTGRTVGEGIAHGLEVSPLTSASTPTVTVNAGFAFNRRGQSVRLGTTTNVGLYAPTPPAANATNAAAVTPFAPCGPAVPGAYLSATGVYLLTIAPTTGTSGVAPVLGLSDGTDKCNAKYIVEGAQFGLVKLPVSPGDLGSGALLRNIVAARCFGFGTDPLVNPFGSPVPQTTPAPTGLIESLRGTTLTDDEVPLAVIGWNVDTGITFVDMWSARRRVSRPDNADDTVLPISDAYRALREAVLLQFQDHLQSLVAATPASTVATTTFQYLPPAGLLPLATSSSPAGFVAATFFQNVTTHGPIAIEGARAETVLRASFDYPQIDLTTGEMIWLFQTRQNMQASTPPQSSQTSAATQTTPTSLAMPYLIFVTGQMPYFGDSRFDAAYFDFSSWSFP
jgi:hypothetical protein